MAPQAYREWSLDDEEEDEEEAAGGNFIQTAGQEVPIITDEEGWRWVRECGFGADLKGTDPHGLNIWHIAGKCGIGANMCRCTSANPTTRPTRPRTLPPLYHHHTHCLRTTLRSTFRGY